MGSLGLSYGMLPVTIGALVSCLIVHLSSDRAQAPF
jgi:hypothetical protein